ncbi:MAG: PIG-L family deacetylase [Candidatus Saccharibacteria bacterium]
MKDIYKKVLIIAPHQDDEIIGCGGLICYAIEKKWLVEVAHVFLGTSGIPYVDDPSTCATIRNQEALDAAEISGYKVLDNLGFIDRDRSADSQIQSAIIKLIRRQKPDVILLPHKGESDLEHQIVYTAGKEAVWLSATNVSKGNEATITHKIKVLYYEVWKPIDNPVILLDISRYISNKQTLLSAFKTQMEVSGWLEGIIGLNAYRGVINKGKGYVEAFTTEPLDLTEINL